MQPTDQSSSQVSENGQEQGYNKKLAALCLGALGIVFGDIGTSPLYALRECFGPHYGLSLNAENVVGILSLIFWTIVIMICLKYVAIILRADNKGEGGILSLMALATGSFLVEGRKRVLLVIIGVFGAALLYGDGMITPAISVLSAIEGIKVVTPVFESFVIPITIAIIALMFMFQRFGTGSIGVVFGPIILLWFLVLGSLGISSILENPQVLMALNPYYTVKFFIDNGSVGFFVLGSVVLVVTGGEALYADMGHFGRRPIQWAWFSVALPALVLNYFGQGALLLRNPEAIKNPFYLLAPSWGLVPLVVLATMATIIASQALISGVFSLTRQAVQLGFAPRLEIIHTSSKEIGQVYVPFVNWVMAIAVIWIVVSFKNSSDLAAAYGVAVTSTMVITSILAIEVARRLWKWSWAKTILVFGFFLIFDLSFFITNIVKVPEGGWVPLVLGAGIYLLMSTWQKGRKILAERLKVRSIPLESFIQEISNNPPLRVPGIAIYMSSDAWGVPVPLLHNLKHNKVLHEKILILTIKTKEIPLVPKQERVQIEKVSTGFYRVMAYYGFKETPKIKHILDACREQGIAIAIQDTTFVLGRETILATGDPTLSIWREKIFAFMARNALRPTAFFKIPPNQVIEVGIQIEI